MSIKQWKFAPLDKALSAQLAEECGLDPFLSLLLTNRGFSDPDEIEQFLHGDELTDDPFAFAGMPEGVHRIQQALDEHEPMAVYGDYDADGITATVLLYTYLRDRGADVRYLIPKREDEGYGLHSGTIDRLAADGVRLLITVDNGITAVDEVKYATQNGIDVVVTDHHRPQDPLPPAAAVIDPHREDCGSGFKDYAGVGVAFQLVCALEGDSDWVLEQYADLVALGTLADIMPIRGENRVLVRAGLRQINAGRRIGLQKLLEAAGAGGKAQTSTTAVFSLAPRINAAGRMGHPQRAAELLLAADEEEAARLAQEIHALNIERQQLEGKILKEVLSYIEAHPQLMADRVLVLSGNGWHGGVVGILAARVLERFGKPCILLSVNDGYAKGSGRSIAGFPLFDAIASCADLLTTYGGHELAAGVGLWEKDIDAFRRRINAYAAAHFPSMPLPTLTLDFKLSPAQITVEKLDLIGSLEPFGTGNPSPLFGLYGMQVDGILPVGGGKHLRLSLSRDGTPLTVMLFHCTLQESPVRPGDVIHLAVTVDKNEYHGVVSPSVIAKDLHYADTDQDALVDGLRGYYAAMRGELPPSSSAASLVPTRDELAAVYRFLRRQQAFTGSLEHLQRRLRDAAGTAPGFAPLRISLEVLREAGLIACSDTGDRLAVRVLPVGGKVDLNDTPLMRTLHTLRQDAPPAAE